MQVTVVLVVWLLQDAFIQPCVDARPESRAVSAPVSREVRTCRGSMLCGCASSVGTQGHQKQPHSDPKSGCTRNYLTSV